MLAAGGLGWFATQSRYWTGADSGWTSSTSRESERSEEAYAVSAAPSLKIDSFAGNVIVRSGPSGVINVAATRRARGRDDSARIEVQVSERGGGLVIKTSKPSSVRNASVDLEITAPASTGLDLHTGAGNVDVDGIAGEIDAHTGAGNFDVRGAAVCARLDAGAGSIRYQGTPQGNCRFETGAGNIALELPADPDVRVNLQTGAGKVDVDFDVDGRVSGRKVQGVIGSGAQGEIYARAGAGNIALVRR
jgi:hypothetical protein